MAINNTNKTISSTDSGFPGYLDFTKLRSEAIKYLGNLSGNIWTDHNVHDPGITILEVLTYAILDLGYRTHLPTVDLFERNPDDKTDDNNFFTPAQILANNPLTITDYRKLLIDIEGVRNAWLEIDEGTSADFCPQAPVPQPVPIPGVPLDVANPNNEREVCECNLNGLYHVYIELEKDYVLTDPKQKVIYDDLVDKIKCTLMQHRNLCEDFIDIKILCKTPIGLCADIEIAAGANGEDVYVQIIETLLSFFSPSPKFYTLSELLKKGKPIEEIFAGRPYDIKESHGFVDVDEFDQIKLRRKVELSDVYHVLLDITGVKNIRNLKWRLCADTNDSVQVTDWELLLPENFLPEFSIECSGLQFFKYGMKIQVNQQKYKMLLTQNFSSNGKVLQASSNLDAAIPKGIYRSDLADYYSIQNEFPHIYGIGKGDLAENESNERKAKALQLQGFLLFFDQLLANYLMQLKNIRSLFALSSSETGNDHHTYFTNELTNVPQLQKLLRFKTGDGQSATQASAGSNLAYPTKRQDLEELINSGRIKNSDLEGRCSEDDFPPYAFCFGAERDQAVTQLREDILYGDYEAVVLSTNDECYFFYLFTSSNEFALISKRYYKDEQDAKNAAASLQYAASFEENYRTFISTNCDNNSQCFSFDIALTLDTYSAYLNVIVEDKSLYLSRRQGFLNHLMARFSEQFTDFALLSANFLSEGTLQQSQIKYEEKFLTNYPALSSNRGKAYNYFCNGWETDNVSGFENRFKALAGIDDWRKHYLCNFVVEEADKQYLPEVIIDEKQKLTLQTPLNKTEAVASVNAISHKLNTDAFFEIKESEQEKGWQLFIRDDFNNKYVYSESLPTKDEAANKKDILENVFVRTPDRQKHLYIEKYIYKIEFAQYPGEVIAEYAGNDKNKLNEKPDAEARCKELSADINTALQNDKLFTWVADKQNLSLLSTGNSEAPFDFINEKAFEVYFVEDVNLTEDVKYRYAFRDINKKILFESVNKFETESAAGEAFKTILPFLTRQAAYYVQKNSDGDDYGIFVRSDESNAARYYQSFQSETDAKNGIAKIVEGINAYAYTLNVSPPIPFQWKFDFSLVNVENKSFLFRSESTFMNADLAFEAAETFYAGLSSLQLRVSNNQLILSPDKNNKAKWVNPSENEGDINEVKKQADEVLNFQKALLTNTEPITEQNAEERLKAFQINKDENYIYKLVDKDNLLAEHTAATKLLTEADADAARDELFHTTYHYIDINIGGSDIFCYYDDALTSVRWYHYQIKCTNKFYTQGNVVGKELVLFQSVRGYASKEEALKAFTENLFIVLKYAEHEENYGDGKPISVKEFVAHTDDECFETTSIVCVPRYTSDEFNGYEVQKQIIPLVKRYPIKYISQNHFRFALYNDDPAKNRYDWRSVQYYETWQQAMQQFQFLLILLKFPGNYYIELSKTDCRYHIYIREVLAQSASGFKTCEEAWGENGIEKFICVAQAAQGFHNYFRQSDCSHSFFVACGNTGLIHPCKYETPERRDQVLKRLFEASSFDFFDLLQPDDNNFWLLNLEQKQISRIIQRVSENNDAVCDRLIEFFQSVYISERYIQKDEKTFYLEDASHNVIATPASPDITLMEWKKQLLEVSCYFPLYKIDSDSEDGDCNYTVQIKLPGFNSCDECSEGNTSAIECNDDACIPGCYVAWKSDCCFDSCCEALLFYILSRRMLGIYEYYRRVYECDCGYYGIELHAEKIPGKTVELRSAALNNDLQFWARFCRQADNNDNNNVFNNRLFENIRNCVNEVVAINPQQYSNENIACEAVERAKKLINSEGLHLVEHILLRPHCINDGVYQECACDALPRPCIDDSNNCIFTWIPGDEDRCNTEEPICFTPGCDPYSFIATLALPAWPQRFRSADNRAVIENLLQKEAPAHVLLRILWLRPRDFCCFEYYFKLWNEWLAKKLCADYDNCDFLRLLFQKYFKPLDDCKICIPCACDDEQPDSCFEDEKEPCADFRLTDTLNKLFCWYTDNESYDFSNCEPCNCREENEPGNDVILKKAKKKSPIKLPKDVEHHPHPEAEVKAEPAPLPSREKVKLIQARANRYNENVKQIVDANPGSKTAEKASRFLSDTNPSPKRFDDLLNQILKDKSNKSKNIKALTLKQKQILISNITWQYLDRLSFSLKNTSTINEHQFLFNHLRKNKIAMETLFDEWNSGEVKQIEADTDIDEIKRVLT